MCTRHVDRRIDFSRVDSSLDLAAHGETFEQCIGIPGSRSALNRIFLSCKSYSKTSRRSPSQSAEVEQGLDGRPGPFDRYSGARRRRDPGAWPWGSRA